MTLAHRGDRNVLVATIAASSMGFLMQSVTVALPAIQAELGADGAEALWIINGFLLFLGALILVGGALGDRYGRKRVFRVGVVGFGVMSLLCGLAPSIELLIMARMGQGVLGALMIPNSLALLSASFEGEARGQAIGTWSAMTTLASIAAPIIGGTLVDNGLWRAFFLMTVPFAVASLVALRTVPESQQTQEHTAPLDWLGAGLVTFSLACIVFGAMRLGGSDITDITVWGSLLLGVLSAVAFLVVESRVAHPILPLGLFRSPVFSGTNAYTFVVYGALTAISTFATVYLVEVGGYEATAAGVAFLPLTAGIILLSPYAGRLAGRIGARPLLVVGGLCLSLACVGLGLVPLGDGTPDYFRTYFIWIALFGIGLGLVVAPLTTSVMTAGGQANAGIASGVNNAVARSAGAMVTALLSALLIFVFTSTLSEAARPLLGEGGLTSFMAESRFLMLMPTPEAFAAPLEALKRVAYHEAFVWVTRVCAGLMLTGAGLAFWTLRPRPAL